MSPLSSIDAPTVDAYAPREIALRVSRLGVAKARSDTVSLLLLSVLAGAFISLGALLFAVVVTDSALGFGPTRLLGGVAFSLGLVLVVVAGAELFTGNNLIAMAWASRLISLRELLRSWVIVYAGNLVGALLTVAMCFAGHVHSLGGGKVQETLLAIAHAKTALDPVAMLALGVLCNALVCLAVWLTQAGHSVVDKVVGVVFPIAAFVALGFEHSIANMFFLPYALLIEGNTQLLSGAVLNLVVVTVGNIAGGTGLVAGVYWLAYLRRGSTHRPRDAAEEQP
ncbi:MAG: formate/nitrite transporter family protein [Deltaproteobacteria bacterium]|nr:formate/nitrite transporter family protein [Deltaproteobacteria bacterium]